MGPRISFARPLHCGYATAVRTPTATLTHPVKSKAGPRPLPSTIPNPPLRVPSQPTPTPTVPTSLTPVNPRQKIRPSLLNLPHTPRAEVWVFKHRLNNPGPFDQSLEIKTLQDWFDLPPEPTHERRWIFFKRKIPLTADPELPWSKQLPEVKERMYKEAFRRWMGIYVASPFFIYFSWQLFYYGYLGHRPEWDFYQPPWGMDEEELAAWEVKMVAKRKYWAERRAMWDTPIKTVSPAS